MRSSSGWEAALRQILTPDSSTVVAVNAIVRLPDHISPIRPIPVAIEPSCPAAIRWCTQSYDAKEKCQVLRTAALTTGIVPNIICNDYRSDTITVKIPCCIEMAHDLRFQFHSAYQMFPQTELI